MKKSLKHNIVQLPAPENQPAINKAVEPITPNWKAIRRQLYKLFSDGRLTDPFNREVMAIVLGPGSIGPTKSLSTRDGILYITGELPRYFHRACPQFQAFHKACYGYELALPKTFEPVDLRTYRLMYFWERAKQTQQNRSVKNLRQFKKIR